MMRWLAALATLAVVAALGAGLAVADGGSGDVAIPKLDGHVVDTAHVLSSSEVLSLDQDLEQFRLQHGYAIVVFVYPTSGTQTIADVAYKAFNQWGVGDKGKDNGVLVALATIDRKVRIETGKGVGGVLTDIQSNDIIRGKMAPAFKQGQYDAGLRAGTEAIELALLAEPGAPGAVETRPPAKLSTTWLIVIVSVVAFLIAIGIGCVVSPGFRGGTWAVLQVFGFILEILSAFSGGSGSSGSSSGSSGGGGGSGYGGGGGSSGGGGSDDSY